MKAKDIMSRPVATVLPDDKILHAARLMLQKGYSGLPVVDSAGSIVGIVTEGDFLRRSETQTMRRRPRWLEFLVGAGHLAGEYTRAAGQHVKDVMTGNGVYTVEEDANLQEIIDLFERHGIKRVPVVRESKVVGIVTRQNLLRALTRSSAKAPATYNDDAIRKQIDEELANQSWAPFLTLSVTNGHVKLSGTIFDDRQRAALRVLLENVPGVKSIEDQLVFIEPMSGMVIESPKATAA